MHKPIKGRHVWSFRDKYLALTIVAALFSLFSVAQSTYDSTKTRQTQSSYGFDWANARFRSTIVIPNDTPKLALKDSGAISYLSHRVWTYDGVNWHPITLVGGVDGITDVTYENNVICFYFGSASSCFDLSAVGNFELNFDSTRILVYNLNNTLVDSVDLPITRFYVEAPLTLRDSSGVKIFGIDADGLVGGGTDSTAFNSVTQNSDSSFTLHKLNGDSTTVTFEGGIDATNVTNRYLNAFKNFVPLNTDSITQGATNKWYTDALARAAISLTVTGSGAATYNNTTGVLNVPTPTAGEPVITAPNTILKYLTGYKTFGSFLDTARTAISLTTTGSGAATYNSSTGVLNVPTPSAGTGTVSNFSAGDLSPLFTTTEATTTTTPALSFALSNAAASTVFGRSTTLGAPSFITGLDSSFLASNFHTEPYYDGRYWKKTGNTPTDTALHFIGNIDNKRLNFRVNNNQAGLIDSSSQNTFIGYRAGAVARPQGYVVNGMKNTAFGFEALTSDTTGYSNLGIGVRAGWKVTSGAGNILIGELAGGKITTGSFNLAIGQEAIQNVTTASYNLAIGYKAGESTTSATNNVAIGYTAMQGLTSGSNSTAIGYRAMQGNNGSNSTAMGAYSQGNTAGGSDNTSFGYGTLYNATGNNNTAVGENAGINNSSGAANTYLGTNSGNGVTTGSNNTIIGANTTGLAAGLTNNVILADGSGNKRLWAGSTGVVSLFPGAAVASAAAIVPTGNLFHVTGTATITSITATNINAGATITIIFDGALTFTDGSNLKLNGNFTTAADATITLVFDGTNFYETSRSTN